MAAEGLYDCPSCGGECGTGPCVQFVTNDCVDAVELLESEICTIVYSCPDPDDPSKPLYKPNDWTNTADIEAAIVAGAVKINVIGDLAEPTQETITISKGRQKVGKKTFVLNADIDEASIVNYDEMRKLECGATLFIWYGTLGGWFFGGENGVRVDVTRANMPLTRGENQYKRILLGVTWDSTCHPPATDQVELD